MNEKVLRNSFVIAVSLVYFLLSFASALSTVIGSWNIDSEWVISSYWNVSSSSIPSSPENVYSYLAIGLVVGVLIGIVLGFSIRKPS